MKNFITKEYELTTKKEINDKRIVTISDFHFNTDTTILELDKLLIQINDLLPEYIFILGDITPFYNLENQKFKEKLLYFFKLLKDIGKTYLIFGNHDYIMTKEKERFFVSTNKLLDFYDKAKIQTIDNTLIQDDDLNLIGFNKLPTNYHPFELRDINKLRKEIQTLLEKIKNILDDKRYTIFLTHSHLDLMRLEIEFLNSLDLILAGHTHNGLVPNWLEPIFPKTRSIITSQKLFQNQTRGLIKNNQQNIIVNGGMTKISDSHSKFIKNLTNSWYPSEIDLIKVKKK